MAGEFGPSFHPGEKITVPEAEFEIKIAKAKEFLLRVIKTWIDAVPKNLQDIYFGNEDAMRAKTEIAEYIRDLAAGAVTNDSDDTINRNLDIIGDHLYGLMHIEENKGAYIAGESGAWRLAGAKSVMQGLMRKVGYPEDTIGRLLPSGSASAAAEQQSDAKVIDGSDEFNRLAHEAPAATGKAEQSSENPESKASG